MVKMIGRRKVLAATIAGLCFGVLTTYSRLPQDLRKEYKSVAAIPNVHQLSVETPYSNRIIRIRQECSRKVSPPSRNFKRSLNIRRESFKYIDNLQLVMCETPKVSSTTWQLVLLRLSGFNKEFTDQLLKKWAYDEVPNKHFGNLKSDEEMWRRMQNYTTFLITRHPFERLVSAYYDKLSNRSKYSAYRSRVGSEIARQQAHEHLYGLKSYLVYFPEEIIRRSNEFQMLTGEQRQDVLNYLKVLKTGEVSFLQFVKFLIQYYNRDEVDEMDIHWRPQASICQPCLFNYSYIIKFDRLQAESNRLLNYLKRSKMQSLLTEKLYFPAEPKRQSSSALTRETILQIPETRVETLRQIYHDDFILYDYDPYLYSGH